MEWCLRIYVAGLGCAAIWGGVRGWGGYWPLFMGAEQQLLEINFTVLDEGLRRSPSMALGPEVQAAYQEWLRVRWPFRALAEATGWARVESLVFYFQHPRSYFPALLMTYVYFLGEARQDVEDLPADIRAARSASLERWIVAGNIFLAFLLVVGLG
jgi:hypothetical protein